MKGQSHESTVRAADLQPPGSMTSPAPGDERLRTVERLGKNLIERSRAQREHIRTLTEENENSIKIISELVREVDPNHPSAQRASDLLARRQQRVRGHDDTRDEATPVRRPRMEPGIQGAHERQPDSRNGGAIPEDAMRKFTEQLAEARRQAAYNRGQSDAAQQALSDEKIRTQEVAAINGELGESLEATVKIAWDAMDRVKELEQANQQLTATNERLQGRNETLLGVLKTASYSHGADSPAAQLFEQLAQEMRNSPTREVDSTPRQVELPNRPGPGGAPGELSR
jgi:hypothetical protein